MNKTKDNVYAIKNESEPTKTGDRWEAHTGERFTTEVVDDEVHLHYDNGTDQGPFTREEFEDSREYLNFLGNDHE